MTPAASSTPSSPPTTTSHTGIGKHTPADVHYGHTTAVNAQDQQCSVARGAHRERFTTERDPKILALPTDTWINQPAEHPAA